MSDDRKAARYAVRPDASGWTIYETWTGEPAVLASKRQVGLSEDDARHTAGLLDQRARDGDRSMRG